MRASYRLKAIAYALPLLHAIGVYQVACLANTFLTRTVQSPLDRVRAVGIDQVGCVILAVRKKGRNDVC